MNRAIIDAIELDVVHRIVGDEFKHPLCWSCNDCTLGISAGTIDATKCPFCGAERLPNGIVPYNGAANWLYGCGTAINICMRHTDSFITTVAIGDECHGIDDGEDII